MSATDLLVDLRQLSAHGHAPLRLDAGEARERGREPLRRLETDRRMLPVDELLPQRRAIPLGAREVADEPVLLAREPARDECGLDGGCSRQHRHGDPGLQRRGDEPRARVVDAGQAGIGDERYPLACL